MFFTQRKLFFAVRYSQILIKYRAIRRGYNFTANTFTISDCIEFIHCDVIETIKSYIKVEQTFVMCVAGVYLCFSTTADSKSVPTKVERFMSFLFPMKKQMFQRKKCQQLPKSNKTDKESEHKRATNEGRLRFCVN